MEELKLLQARVRDACGIELSDAAADRLALSRQRQLARAATLLRELLEDDSMETHADVLAQWAETGD